MLDVQACDSFQDFIVCDNIEIIMTYSIAFLCVSSYGLLVDKLVQTRGSDEHQHHIDEGE